MSRAFQRLQRLHFHVAASPCEAQASPCACSGQDLKTPVAIVLGAGAGVGQGVARKFAKEGFHVVVVRRGEGSNRLLKPGDNTKAKMEEFAESLRQSGGQATPMFADCTVPDEIAKLFQKVEETIGPIHFVNYNIGAQVGDRPLERTDYRIFELAWRLGSLGAFATAKEAAKYMVPRGYGTIVYTSATAALRGRDGQHAHTAAMGGRRMLTQSLAAELGPKGIHIAHVNIDGPINAPETLGVFINRAAGGSNAFAQTLKRLQATEEIVEPSAVADTYFHIHMQPRGVWTQELDVKPWTTKAWFSNSEGNATQLMSKKGPTKA